MSEGLNGIIPRFMISMIIEKFELLTNGGDLRYQERSWR